MVIHAPINHIRSPLSRVYQPHSMTPSSDMSAWNKFPCFNVSAIRFPRQHMTLSLAIQTDQTDQTKHFSCPMPISWFPNLFHLQEQIFWTSLTLRVNQKQIAPANNVDITWDTSARAIRCHYTLQSTTKHLITDVRLTGLNKWHHKIAYLN